MTQYNSLNVKLSNSQLNKIKSAIKNATKVVVRLSSNMVGSSDDNTIFSDKLYITELQIFVKLLPINHRLILTYLKLNDLK